MHEAKRDEDCERGRREVRERHRRKDDGTYEEQSAASEHVRQRAGGQFDQDAGERGGTHDESNQRRAGA